MRIAIAAGLAAMIGGGASAAPGLQIRGAVARVVVVPEARSNVVVTILKTNPRLPLRVKRFGDQVIVDGDVGGRAHVCHSFLGHPSVGVWGRGDIRYRDMPQIVVHAPMDVRLSAGEAVFGSIGRSDSLTFTNKGCGDWTIGNVRGKLRLSEAGSGDTRSGTAGSADLSVAGSGDVSTQAVSAGATAVSTGSGDISLASVGGPFNIRIAGSGNVKARGGEVSTLTASIAGSGDVRFGGVAQTLNAQIAGSGRHHGDQGDRPGEPAGLPGTGDINVGH